MRHHLEVPRSRLPLTAAFLLVAAVGCVAPETPGAAADFPSQWRYSATETAISAMSGMVVSTDEYASQVGLEVLQSGGNAVDAAIAVQFALAVVNPEAGNIGGGGFMVVRTSDGRTAAVDYREKAPVAATRDMFLDDAGNLTDRSVVGHLAAGVPGTVAGMWAAHERFGTVPWSNLVQPAVELARGFEVKERFLGSLARPWSRHSARIRPLPGSFFPVTVRHRSLGTLSARTISPRRSDGSGIWDPMVSMRERQPT